MSWVAAWMAMLARLLVLARPVATRWAVMAAAAVAQQMERAVAAVKQQ